MFNIYKAFTDKCKSLKIRIKKETLYVNQSVVYEFDSTEDLFWAYSTLNDIICDERCSCHTKLTNDEDEEVYTLEIFDDMD